MVTRWIRRQWNWATLTPLRTGIAGTLAGVLVAALVVGSLTLDNLINGCGTGGIYHRGAAGECTGVTDGSYLYASQLKDIEKAILQQNKSLGSGPHATVALLLPMTDPDPATQTEILHAVEGAYIAQYRADNAKDQKELAPPIRLVLVNPGVASAHWQPVVEQLAGMTGPGDNLRAVVGISVSIDATKEEVHWLTAAGIPVVGGAITADDLANVPGTDQPYPGLARIEPTNTQEAAALASFGNVNPKQALLVQDTRTDDDYITTLVNAFKKVLVGSPYEAKQFTSPQNESKDGDTYNTFYNSIVPNICQTSAKWIYFAGRQVQLRQFINAIEARGCPQKFTILTGSAGSHLGSDPELDRAAFGRFTLEYAAIASPGEWTQSPQPTGGSLSDYQVFLNSARAAIGPVSAADLEDGQAIINYDATWTAITAIRSTTGQGVTMPSLLDIAHEWRQLYGVNRVHGASGWICLDNSGNPYDKAVPIVGYTASGQPQFIKLAWPDGAPPPAGCQPPNGS